MASSSSSLPRPRMPDDDDDLEEGQFIPGGDESSDTDDDGGRYPLHRSPREDEEARVHPPPHGHKRRDLTLEEVLTLGRGEGDALPSPTPLSKSDRTISDDANPSSSPASVFMTTTQQRKRAVAALDDAQVQAVIVHQPAAPPPQPALLLHLAQLAHQAAAPPPPAEQHEHVELAPHGPAAAAAADHPRREYTCKECGKSYPTNQALGGHAAGHRNKRRQAEAAAAASGMAPEDGGALRRGRGAGALHECRKCRKVFATGVALGGHMRVHYTGPPIVPRRKNKKKIRGLALGRLAVDDVAAPPPPPPGLSLALSIKTEESPSPAPAGPARVVRLFGIDISPQVQQAPSEQLGSGTTEEISYAGAHHQQQ